MNEPNNSLPPATEPQSVRGLPPTAFFASLGLIWLAAQAYNHATVTLEAKSEPWFIGALAVLCAATLIHEL